MSPRITIALALVVALVGAYIVVVDRPQAQRAEEARHLVHLPKASITQITVRSGKNTAELVRTDATHWMLTRPFTAPASTYAVSDLLDGVLAIVPQRTVADKTTDWAAYGLATPDTELTLHTQDGKTAAVDIGKTSPVSTGLYARAVPGDAVYLVDASAREALAKTAADLRQKTLADFSNADVQHVRVTSPSGVLAVDRIGSDRWRLGGAHPWPADDFKVTDLFFPVTTSDAKAFHDGVRDLVPYGLDHPAVTVEVTLKNRSMPLRLIFASKGKVTYAMVAGASTVLELDAGLVKRLTPASIALVSKRLLPYNAQNLTAVTWSRPGVPKDSHRSSESLGWAVLQIRRQGPGFSGGGLSDSQITDMFSSINILEADTVEALAAPPPGAPAFAVQTDGGEGAQFRLMVYHRPGGAWLATNPALGLQYGLPSNAFDGFPKAITAFLGLPKAAPAGGTKPAPPGRPATVTPTQPGAGVTPTAPQPGGPSAPAKPPTP
ncbi:MAG TPA: DUF4340 domain-containing protein [bacterium]|nr:DUF4340 domain-containing protein [bacterium]